MNAGQLALLLPVHSSPYHLADYQPTLRTCYNQETVFNDPNGVFGVQFIGSAAPLNVSNMACPTWGLGFSTGANSVVKTTIGPPYLPLIIPPQQVMSLDPQ